MPCAGVVGLVLASTAGFESHAQRECALHHFVHRFESESSIDIGRVQQLWGGIDSRTCEADAMLRAFKR